MPRPKKCRRVCAMPEKCRFGPQDGMPAEGIVIMTVDEYETIRLIDRIGYNQEQCSAQMGVARTTVQAVYDSARRKLAEALVDGKQMVISGGTYTVCPNGAGCCKKGGCKNENCSNL